MRQPVTRAKQIIARSAHIYLILDFDAFDDLFDLFERRHGFSCAGSCDAGVFFGKAQKSYLILQHLIPVLRLALKAI